MSAQRLRSLLLGLGGAVVLTGSLASCQQTPLPGTQLGTFKVSGTTTTNSCGPALSPPDPWVFDAQLSESNQELYWSWIDGTAPLSAPLTTGTTATLSATTTANVDGSGDAGLGPCTMDRVDTIDLTLSAASSPSSFTGTISYTFTVPAGSTCSDQLATAGGEYATLPCTLTYKMTGSVQ